MSNENINSDAKFSLADVEGIVKAAISGFVANTQNTAIQNAIETANAESGAPAGETASPTQIAPAEAPQLAASTEKEDADRASFKELLNTINGEVK